MTARFFRKKRIRKSCTEYSLINQLLKKFAIEQDNCYFVTASGLISNPDGIHINAISQRKFGLRHFEAFYNKKHILEPLANESDLLDSIWSRVHTKSEKIYIKSMDFVLGKITYDEFLAEANKINND